MTNRFEPPMGEDAEVMDWAATLEAERALKGVVTPDDIDWTL